MYPNLCNKALKFEIDEELPYQSLIDRVNEVYPVPEEWAIVSVQHRGRVLEDREGALIKDLVDLDPVPVIIVIVLQPKRS